MSGIRYSSRLEQYDDDDGQPVPGGQVFFYDTGTLDLAVTYSDSDLTTPNTNPLILDASGRFQTDVFLDPAETYRVRLLDADDVLVAEEDPVSGAETAASIATHNADPNAHRQATESQSGFIEIANTAEAIAGTDDARAMTSLKDKAALDARFAAAPSLVMAGPIDENKDTVASASSIDLTGSGNIVDISGTASINTITLNEGSRRLLRFLSTATLVNSASIVIPSGSNFVASANSIVEITAFADNVVTVTDGAALRSPVQINAGDINTSGDTSITIPSGSFSSIEVVGDGIESASDFALYLRINADSGSNYSYRTLAQTDEATLAQQASGALRNAVPISSDVALIDAAGTQNPTSFNLTIRNAKSTTAHKNFKGELEYMRRADGDYQGIHFSGRWLATAAVTSVEVLLRSAVAQDLTGTTVNASAGTYRVIGYP